MFWEGSDSHNARRNKPGLNSFALADFGWQAQARGSVMECGGPPPLSNVCRTAKSSRGLEHSKTLPHLRHPNHIEFLQTRHFFRIDATNVSSAFVAGSLARPRSALSFTCSVSLAPKSVTGTSAAFNLSPKCRAWAVLSG